jgi:hypothetical protein
MLLPQRMTLGYAVLSLGDGDDMPDGPRYDEDLRRGWYPAPPGDKP